MKIRVTELNENYYEIQPLHPGINFPVTVRRRTELQKWICESIALLKLAGPGVQVESIGIMEDEFNWYLEGKL